MKNGLQSGLKGISGRIKNNTLLSKFLSFSIGNWIVLVIGLISTPLITRVIDPTEYGKYSMFTMYANIFMLIITCGLDQAYVRFFYEEEEQNRNKLLFESIKIPVIVNALIIIVVLLFKVPISKIIIGDYSFSFIILLLINVTLASVSRFSLLTVRMKQKGKLYSFLQVAQKIAYLMSIGVFILAFKCNFMTLAYATLISNITIVGISIFSERDTWKFKGIKNKVLKNSQKDIIKYGVPLIFTFMVAWVFQSADKVAIKAYGNYADVGIYGSAMNIIAILNILQSSFATFWTPVSFEKYEKNPEDTKFFSNMNDILSFSMFLIGLGLIIFKDLIVLLLGVEYRMASYIMPFLVFMPVLYTMSEVSVVGINFKKKPKYHIVIASIACIFNIIGNYILVPILGAKGAAISTGISYMILYYARTLISRKLYNVDYHLGRTTIIIVAMAIMATYSSFNDFSIITIALAFANIVIVLILYKDTIKKIISKISKSSI